MRPEVPSQTALRNVAPRLVEKFGLSSKQNEFEPAFGRGQGVYNSPAPRPPKFGPGAATPGPVPDQFARKPAVLCRGFRPLLPYSPYSSPCIAVPAVRARAPGRSAEAR